MRLLVLPIVLVLGLCEPARAQEWTRFRGPNGSGVSPAASIPSRWTAKDTNWKVKLPGVGHSSPVLWGERIFLTSGEEKSGRRLLLCLHAADGRTLWSRDFPGEPQRKHADNSLASATPAVDEGRVYVSWGSPKEYLVVALDHQGKEIWRVDLGPYKAGHGFGVSPMLHEELVIVPNEQDGKSEIVALEQSSGKVRWRAARKSRATYSTPCLFQPKHRPAELILASYEHGISGLDPRTGKVNWELDVFDKGHIEASIGSPIVTGDLVIGMSGWLGVKKEVIALRPGTEAKPKQVYRLTRSAPLVTTPIVTNDLLFLWSDEGVVTCASALSGEVHYQERVEGHYYASPVCAGGLLYNVSRDGDMIVLAASKKFELVARNPLGEGSHSTPAIAGGKMYVRTFGHLLSVGGKTAPSSKLDSAEKGASAAGPAYSAELVAQLVAAAKASGDARHGALVFHAPQFACVSCHKVGQTGGSVGPDLTSISRCLTPEQIVESVLWPKRQVKDEYKAFSVITSDGKVQQGYKEREDGKEIVLRDPATGKSVRLAKADIEECREIGTLMPDGLAAIMTPEQRRDLLRFLMELGRTDGLAELVAHAHTVGTFPVDPAPLNPRNWPSREHPVNRHRVYDFYAREADHFMKLTTVPLLLPQFPGLDGSKFGHWGTQNEKTWADDRWNKTQLGSVMCGVFRGAGVTVPRGVCVRLGDRGEMAACFNPETLCYEALWQGGFVKFSAVRHGFLDGLLLDGKALPRPEGNRPDLPFVYHGFYRHGSRIIFSYSIGGVEMLDAPWVEDGKFTRTVAPAEKHPLAKLTRGGPAQWPQVLTTRGTLGSGGPYVIDTIQPPFENPWNALLFFGDHDFLPDGSALVCTMQGDVWRVEGLDDKLERVRWRRFASGLHQALGLVVADGRIYVLGRDQITRLHDRNGDGEADFHECFSSAYATSPGGHDYICGLQRDRAGHFYTASSKQGLVRISRDGKKADVLATGFRNPDGVGLYPDGALTVPCSEGEWTPASMLCLVQPNSPRRAGSVSDRNLGDRSIGGHQPPYYGYGGPKDGRAPDLPLVYLPRGLDNSSGGQVHISSDRWGPLKDRMIHFSFGACSHFLLLRDEIDGQAQGAVVPLGGEFLSGAHRGRFHPHDGQLYVSGMAGWGNYAVADGCFQRVRYTGQAVQLPSGFRVHENGIAVTFTRPIDRDIARAAKNHFAQAWNYRYSAAYGSPEFSPRHPGTRGHDHLPIAAAHVLADGRSLFLEIPDLQPVNQLHLRLRVDAGPAHDLFATVHRLAAPFTDIPNYKAVARTLAAHPILADLRATAKAAPNPWRTPLSAARTITIQADKNLTFAQRSLTVRPGETIKLTFRNPDAVPHNWVLVKPGSLDRIGAEVNRIIADPDAALRQYVPKSEDVLVYTDIVPPEESFSIYFRAPAQKGRYPYLCTFPGHWMVMNGQMVVE